ncbi:hypothetical protein NF867_06500 [Solitalea sp. MAHUQ-68]|uniref:Uncharacterized protein n=1 Tax=Solitalea agri TaxID=2953739 RepID=A0A9X2F1R4_9SPHI|nr:hypothetical protein [Solitalea agri]MCO4292504.1 hypothetical protein [Solitalea agri]
MFITLTVGSYLIVHGYDEHNKEIVEEVTVQSPAEKVVAVSRIQSISENYVLVTGSHGRLMYWEYTDGYANLKRKLHLAGLMVDQNRT